MNNNLTGLTGVSLKLATTKNMIYISLVSYENDECITSI